MDETLGLNMSVVVKGLLLCIMLTCSYVTSMSCSAGNFLDENRECQPCPPHCPFCDSNDKCLSCDNGYWGPVCELECPYCQIGTSCEKTNGFCLEACKDGRSGILCNATCDINCSACNRTNIQICLKCASGRYPLKSCHKTCSTCKDTACDEDGVCASGCKKRYWSKTCTYDCPKNCLNGSCEWENGTCTEGCKIGYTGPSCNKGHNKVGLDSSIIVVAVVSVVFGFALAAIVTCWVKRKKKNSRPNGISREEEATEKVPLQEQIQGTEQAASVPQKSFNFEETQFSNPSEKKADHKKNTNPKPENSGPSENTRLMKLQNLTENLKRTQQKGHGKEFDRLPKKADRRRGEQRKYKNASFIKRKEGETPYYIACKGPLAKDPGEFAPFWRMVWQENCPLIVMLNTVNQKHLLSEQYWPDNNRKCVHEELLVDCQAEKHYDDYVIRMFVLTLGTDERLVKQLQYTKWPEKGVVENIQGLIDFRMTAEDAKQCTNGPIIVHGRDGVGRTGTFIALDTLLAQIEDIESSVDEVDGEVNVKLCVRNLRKQRTNMVENLEQYEFLYSALVLFVSNTLEKLKG